MFYKEKVKAEITATDDSYTQAGYDKTKHAVKIEYLISNTAMSEEAVEASNFTEYSGTIDLSDEAQYVIYVKLTDHAGNIAYASTDGFEIDTTAPVIENMVDGREETLNSDGMLILRAYRDAEHTLTVTGGEFNVNIQISKRSSLLLEGGSFKSILAKRGAVWLYCGRLYLCKF